MNRIIPIAALTLVLIAGGGFWMSQRSAPQSNDAQFALPGAANAQETTAESDSADTGIVEMVMGNPDASVEVIEYASYTCPHCASFHQGAFKELKENYIDTGKIKFVYREVYFDKYGMWASLIARCGGAEKFFGMTDLIYKGQNEWARAGSDAAIADGLRKIGLLAGMNNDQLESCLSDGTKLRGLVEWYQANIEEHGISSTPSFVVNGTTHSNMSYADFAELIDGQLE